MTDQPDPEPITDRDIVGAIGAHFAEKLLAALARDPGLPTRWLADDIALVLTPQAFAVVHLDEPDIHAALGLPDGEG